MLQQLGHIGQTQAADCAAATMFHACDLPCMRSMYKYTYRPSAAQLFHSPLDIRAGRYATEVLRVGLPVHDRRTLLTPSHRVQTLAGGLGGCARACARTAAPTHIFISDLLLLSII